MNHNIYALFKSHFSTKPNAIFLEHDRGNLLYSEIDPTTGRIACLLRSLGVTKGDRVIVQVDKSPEAVLLYLACLRAGAIFIPLNTAYTTAEVAYFVEDARPLLIVCRPESWSDINNLENRIPECHTLTLAANGTGSLIDKIGSVKQRNVTNAIENCSEDDLASILYTSGTTGRSKGAMLTHKNLSSNAQVLQKYWGWVEGDILLHALPIFHVHGLFVALHCALLNASKIIFLSKFDALKVKEKLRDCTVMMGVPTFYVRLLDDPNFNSQDCGNMRLFVAGSAPLLSETFNEFEKRTGHRILERYGMTEAGMITSNPYQGERLAGTVGYPLPGVNARIAEEQGQVLSAGEVGVLEIKGPNVFKGYWCMPEKTASEFRSDGFFITGDLATMTEDQRVSIVGRNKDLVISGGYNIYPKEIEIVIDELEGVKESAIIGVPHPDFGEGVAAVVVKNIGCTLNEEILLGHLKNKLARFKQPKRVLFVEELPRNAMGKVQKKTLRETYADIYS